MKKQVFSLMMVLAMMILAGTSVKAQDGLLPTTSLEIITGSVLTFTVSEGGAALSDGLAVDYTWTVFSGSSAGTVIQAGNAATAGTDWDFATSKLDHAVPADPTGVTAFIKFLKTPSNATTAGDVYFVQVTGNGTNCSTLRRYWISVFDFNVNVQLCAADGTLIGETNNEVPECNDWSGNVIANSTATPNIAVLDGAQITSENQLNVNNETDNEQKISSRFFKVTINLIGNTSLDLDDIKWRLRYTLFDDVATLATDPLTVDDITQDADLSLYEIAYVSSVGATTAPTFVSAAGTSIAGATASTDKLTVAASSAAFDNNAALYFPGAGGTTGNTAVGDAVADHTISYLFRISTHNLLGANDQTYGIRIDEAAIEKSATTEYNDGNKVHAALATGNALTLTDGISDAYTIQASPATSIIGVTE